MSNRNITQAGTCMPYLCFSMVGYTYVDDMLYGSISLYHYNQNPRDIQNQSFSCNCDRIRIQKGIFLSSTKLSKRQKLFYKTKVCNGGVDSLKQEVSIILSQTIVQFLDIIMPFQILYINQ